MNQKLMDRRSLLKLLGFSAAEKMIGRSAWAQALEFPMVGVPDYATIFDRERAERAVQVAQQVVARGSEERSNSLIQEFRDLFEHEGRVYDLWVANRNENGMVIAEADSPLAASGRELCWYHPVNGTMIRPDSLGIAVWDGTLAELMGRGSVPRHEFTSVEDQGIDGRPNFGHLPGEEYFSEGYIPRAELARFQDTYDRMIVNCLSFYEERAVSMPR